MQQLQQQTKFLKCFIYNTLHVNICLIYRSHAITFHDKGDFGLHEWFLNENCEHQSETVIKHLREIGQKMRNFCHTTICRRWVQIRNLYKGFSNQMFFNDSKQSIEISVN